MQKSPGKKEISLPIREENLKIRKRLHFLRKEKPGIYAQMRKRIRRSQEYPTICQAPGECFQRSLTLNRQGKTPVFIRQKKPVQLLQQILGFVTEEKEWVLDQFAGSFSLGEAALLNERNAICIEINEEYFEKGKERLLSAKSRSR